jgi:hypothetical protein
MTGICTDGGFNGFWGREMGQEVLGRLHIRPNPL